MRITLILSRIICFMLFTVLLSLYVLFFEEFLIHDSRGFMILRRIMGK